MIVSVLALSVSLAAPGEACAIELECVAAPALISAPRFETDEARVLETGALRDLTVDAAALWQDGTDPAQPAPASDAAPDAVATLPQEAEAGEDTGNEIVVEGEVGAPVGDPAEKLNAATYKAVEAVDIALVEPIASFYDKGIPKPIRRGLGNFLRNLGEPINFLNFMLQLKPGKAVKTLGRFAINTTIGLVGVFDVAKKKPFNLRYEYNGLANTLGYYGVGPGPYLYLPFMGSTTVRDLIGRIVDLSIIPFVAGKPFNSPYYAIPVGALTSLESRIETDAQIDAIRERCGDGYAANRDLYLIQRKIEINRLRGRTSDNLGEIQERLEFNCDIEIDPTYRPRKGEGFVKGATTLLEEPAGSTTESPATEGMTPEADVPVAPPYAPGSAIGQGGSVADEQPVAPANDNQSSDPVAAPQQGEAAAQ